ncbi:GGDEF domain-containing protein [Alteromonas facilis]|uniref:GGDEF domain-containing protein n=1 Tax=Alteromonas facilis TaxID=2048004 RepID=UPI000C288D84|nr:GGDEF domain-containing protein [Alteromonas facilis]
METKVRTLEESIIMTISGAISLCLVPFVIIRFLQQDFSVAVLNTVAVSITAAIFFQVYITHTVNFARWGLSLLSVFVMIMTIALKGPDQIVWAYPALTTVFFLLSPSVALIITVLFLASVILIIWPMSSAFFVLKFAVSAGATLLFCYAFASRTHRHQQFLEQIATSDPLTQIGNRRALEEKLLATIERLRRYPDQTCSLIMMDIDLFKQINDQFGHAVGDEVLKQFTTTISDRIRQSDNIYRLGGEEFVVVVENTAQREAGVLADTLVEAIRETQWPEQALKVTMSCGVAEFNRNETAYEWIARADAAMYKAKTQGRDQSHVAEPVLSYS